MSSYHVLSVPTHRCQQKTPELERVVNYRAGAGMEPRFSEWATVLLTTPVPKTSTILKIEGEEPAPFDLSVESL